MHQFTVKSESRTELIDITDEVHSIISQGYVREGLCNVFIPHTTAGVTINENADPAVVRDIIYELNKKIPLDNNYEHAEGNSDAHIKASLVGFSVMIPIESGRLALGTWQGIYLCEFDGPRTRKVCVTLVSEAGQV